MEVVSQCSGSPGSTWSVQKNQRKTQSSVCEGGRVSLELGQPVLLELPQPSSLELPWPSSLELPFPWPCSLELPWPSSLELPWPSSPEPSVEYLGRLSPVVI